MDHFLPPWLEPIVRQFSQFRQEDRWHHALLIHIRPGDGAPVLLKTLAKLRLCENSSSPCNQCPTCLSVASSTCPDLLAISAEKNQIKIEQIQTLNQTLRLSAHKSGGARVILIHNAHQMNTSAQNAFLKLLEEPGKNIYFILSFSEKNKLLPTIISRAQQYHINLDKTQLIKWLAAAENISDEKAQTLLVLSDMAPLVAQTMSKEGRAFKDRFILIAEFLINQSCPVLAAEQCSSLFDSTIILLDWLQIIISDLLKIHYNQACELPLFATDLSRIASNVNTECCLQLYQFLTQTKAKALNHSNLNPLLLVEFVLINLSSTLGTVKK